jgi:site-specific DNA recombinase
LDRRFKTITDVGRFLLEKEVIKAKHGKKVFQTAERILKNVFYAGFVHYPKYEVVMIPGKHKGVISLDQYQQIQEILNKKQKGKNEREYQMYRDEFELRGIARCLECGTKFDTYTTTKKKNGEVYYKRDYYDCKNRNCKNYSKVLVATQVHEYFESILKTVEPVEKATEIGIRSFESAISEFAFNLKQQEKTFSSELEKMTRKIEELTDAIVSCKSLDIKKVYEDRLEKIIMERKVLESKLGQKVDIQAISRTALERMLEIIKSPYVLWKKCDAKQKKDFYEYIFIDDLYITRENKSRTPRLTQIYQYSQGEKEKTESLDSVSPFRWTLAESNR